MKKLQYLLALLALLITLQLDAQDKRPIYDWFYADVKLGLVLFEEHSSNTQFTYSAGVRITENHGIGIGFHGESAGNAYNRTGLRGYGLDYRYTTSYGLIAKAGGGIVTTGYRYTDGIEEWRYTDGGSFVDFSLDYQFRFGLTVGVYYSRAFGMEFDYYTEEPPLYVMTFNRAVTERMTNYGISLGYALPWRIRKKRNDNISRR